MAYFSKFPRVRYSFDDGATDKVAVDIVKRVRFRDYLKTNTSYFTDYILRDGDTPDIVADRLYGDSELHWVLMLFNETINPYYDWSISQREMEAYADNTFRGETYFLTDWTGGETFPSDFGVVRNQTIRGVEGNTFGSLDGITYGLTAAALVRRWDKTYSRLEVIGITGDGFTQGDLICAIGTSADGSTYSMAARISRRVQRSAEALHHFYNSADGSVLNPYGTPPQGVTGAQAILGYTGGSTFGPEYDYFDTVAGITNTLLYAYVVDGSNAYVKTNYQHLEDENEDNRTIKIIRPEYIQRVLRDFEDLMRG